MMKLRIFGGLAVLLVVTSAALAQEERHEVSIQGTGFFTRDTDSNGISRTNTNSGGLLAGYRYRINKWVAAEGDYGFTRNTQLFSAGVGSGRIQSDVHAITGDVVVNLPLQIGKLSPYVLGGGGALAFRPTQNVGGFVPGASPQTQGAFLYGVGADYALSHRFALRAEYRGLVYKAPDFSLPGLNSDSWTHTAQPSAGVVFRF
jgi:outer membrane immunogenic protein